MALGFLIGLVSGQKFDYQRLNVGIEGQNKIWAGAMCLAWNELQKLVGVQELSFFTSSKKGKTLLQNFNSHLFKGKDLKKNSFYAKAGYGQSTIDSINKQLSAKFPNKSIKPLQYQLASDDIISYGYLFKKVQYQIQFKKLDSVDFKDKKVKGFGGSGQTTKQNIMVLDYQSPLKNKDERMVIAKGYDTPPLQTYFSHQHDSTRYQIRFAMPVLNIDFTREYTQLEGSLLQHTTLKGYSIQVMTEVVKAQINELGATVQQQATMIMSRSLPPKVQKLELVLDQDFWVIMGERGHNPYLIAGIRDTHFMEEAD